VASYRPVPERRGADAGGFLCIRPKRGWSSPPGRGGSGLLRLGLEAIQGLQLRRGEEPGESPQPEWDDRLDEDREADARDARKHGDMK